MNDKSEVQKDKSLKAQVEKGEIITDSHKEMLSYRDKTNIGEKGKKTLHSRNNNNNKNKGYQII
jgi:hypothetical protein